MQIRINIWIALGWVLFLISLIIPWSLKFFNKPLEGMFWIAMNFFPFYHMITFTEVKTEHINSYFLILSALVVLLSPIFLYLLNRTFYTRYAYIGMSAFPLSLAAFFFEYFVPRDMQSPDFVIGYLVYVCACALIAKGFRFQLKQVQS